MGFLALLGAALTAGRARAQEIPQVPVRVQQRLVQKQGQIEVALGPTLLLRGDFYHNPGLQMTVGYWLRERAALELSAGAYFPVESAEATQVRQMWGFLPDSRQERATAAVGARLSLGYGKVLFGQKTVVHFDPQLFLHAGIHYAQSPFEGALGPTSDFGFSLASWLGSRCELRLDLGLTVQGERRTDWVAVLGFLPTLSFGVLL